MTLAAIRSDLVQRLSVIPDLQAYTTIPAKPEVPCVVLHPGPIVPHGDLDGDQNVTFRVQVLVQFADWDAAQQALDSYVDVGVPTSVTNALERGTGGSENVTVTLIDGYGQVAIGDTTYGTVTFTVEVLP